MLSLNCMLLGKTLWWHDLCAGYKRLLHSLVCTQHTMWHIRRLGAKKSECPCWWGPVAFRYSTYMCCELFDLLLQYRTYGGLNCHGPDQHAEYKRTQGWSWTEDNSEDKVFQKSLSLNNSRLTLCEYPGVIVMTEPTSCVASLSANRQLHKVQTLQWSSSR